MIDKVPEYTPTAPAVGAPAGFARVRRGLSCEAVFRRFVNNNLLATLARESTAYSAVAADQENRTARVYTQADILSFLLDHQHHVRPQRQTQDRGLLERNTTSFCVIYVCCV